MKTAERCALLLVACGSLSCAPRGSVERGVSPPPGLLLTIPAGHALSLAGELRGPLAGLGPELEFELLLAEDRRIRADLHYEVDGRAQHDVILWTQSEILSFDRRRGGVQELGSGGRLEFAGAELDLSHLAFLALGRWPAPAPKGSWTRQGGRWRSQLGALQVETSWNQKHGRGDKQEIRWREGDEARRLTAYVRQFESSALGPIPRHLELAGSGIRGRIQLELRAEVVEIDELTDFDPLQRR